MLFILVLRGNSVITMVTMKIVFYDIKVRWYIEYIILLNKNILILLYYHKYKIYFVLYSVIRYKCSDSFINTLNESKEQIIL